MVVLLGMVGKWEILWKEHLGYLQLYAGSSIWICIVFYELYFGVVKKNENFVKIPGTYEDTGAIWETCSYMHPPLHPTPCRGGLPGTHTLPKGWWGPKRGWRKAGERRPTITWGYPYTSFCFRVPLLRCPSGSSFFFLPSISLRVCGCCAITPRKQVEISPPNLGWKKRFKRY